MISEAFRHFYEYHFSENRKVWDVYITPLSYEQFTRDVGYSLGSIQSQIVHLISVDEVWFCEVRGVELSEPLPPADFDVREALRAYWDRATWSTKAPIIAPSCSGCCTTWGLRPAPKIKSSTYTIIHEGWLQVIS